ncbi:MAG: transglutaminase family protein, partial [Myxococcota bacterium]
MRVFIQHRTEYRYAEPVALGPHIVRLCPAAHTQAEILSYSLTIEPECELRWQNDPWGNRIARLTFDVDTKPSELRFTVDASFDIKPVNPFDFFIDDRSEEVPFRYPDGIDKEFGQFLTPPPPSPLLAQFIEDVPLRGRTIDYLVALNQKVAERVAYIIRDEPGIQTSEETLQVGRGSCRDSARLLVDVLRARGIAARFVSGYLIQLMDEGIIPDLPKGMDRDVVDLHAWAEAYLPGAGWIGLDGTSGLLCGEGHIPLACMVNPELAAAITGTASLPTESFHFDMAIGRIGHEPRPHRPYTEEMWTAIRSAGDRVDSALREAGLALTCGGEPTWTSREHPREPEWNTEAVGPTKWPQALRLAEDLGPRLGTGTLTMQRMGKQYPGESLPRWILHLLWRGDDVPVWRDPALLAASSPGPDAAGKLALARGFAEALAGRLEVPIGRLVPGYEDPWHFVMERENLPPDLDPRLAEPGESEARRRLARVIEHGLANEVGYALPLTPATRGWMSQPWTFRRGHMFLIPGDSPMGLRLPLDRLGGRPPVSRVADTSAVSEPIRFDPRHRDHGYRAGAQSSQYHDGSVRTALCIEPRANGLYVFLPPMPTLEAFLTLVAAIEDTAADRACPVLVEGYAPPSDPRLQSCIVAPDPGVIEVNLPVCHSFAEYSDVVEIIAGAANHAGLCTEKYQLDGREAGSGGGNHLTLGGATAAESPFLQRPHLFGSMLRYLQNHPALSYLFTGLFVGPTSQAPRIDEARHDALYELELALAQIPPPG